MADLNTLIADLRGAGTQERIARRPLAQFGTATRRYIGAEILPERLVRQNAFRDDNVRWKTVIANAGTRYSPVQLKRGALVGSVLVELGNSDIGSELTSADYDALLGLLANNASMEAQAAIINFLDITVNRALVEYNEMQRWQALIARLVTRRGDNAYTEDVALPDPGGHVLYAPTAWSAATVDPFDELAAAAQLLRDKGYEPVRTVTRGAVSSMMATNTNVKQRTGRVTINNSGALVGLGGSASLQDINTQLAADDLPPVEKYDLRYQTSTGSMPFIEDGAVVMIGRAERTEQLRLDNNEVELLEGTLGYVAVGLAAGQSEPGRQLVAEHVERKPPRIEAEGWQTSFPVLQEPEAYVSIRNTHAGTV